MANEKSNTTYLDDSASSEPAPAEMLLSFCNALPDPIYAFDSQGVLTTANNSGALLQGRSAAWLKGKHCCEMFWRVEGAENCIVDRALATGQRVEVELLAGDEAKPILVTVQPEPGEGKPSRSAVVIARDISELRSAEAEALAQRSFMASIADRSPEEIYALDSNGRITWMNERGEPGRLFQLHGYRSRRGRHRVGARRER